VTFRVLTVNAFLAFCAAAQTAAPAAAPAPAPASQKVAVIRFQDAILETKEGQQASAALRAKFDPKKATVEKRQAELQALQDKLQSGKNLTPAERTRMQDELSRGTRSLQRDVDDLNAELQQEEGKIMQDIAGKMADLLQKYAAKNGYSMVLDVSSQQTPVLWADAAANISADIVKEYDALHPVKSAAAAAAIAAPAGVPRPVK
jgi:outer membrane protein